MTIFCGARLLQVTNVKIQTFGVQCILDVPLLLTLKAQHFPPIQDFLILHSSQNKRRLFLYTHSINRLYL